VPQFEVVVEFGLRQVKLDLIERFEGFPEVDQDQVAFVAELRIEG
jgi:hypothetical protein